MKKNMQSVVSALTPLARELPSQNIDRQPAAKPKAPVADEPLVQFSFSLRKSLRKELMRLADDEDMTMRSFILNALKEKGLNVQDDDLLDLRKERGRGGGYCRGKQNKMPPLLRLCGGTQNSKMTFPTQTRFCHRRVGQGNKRAPGCAPLG